jgi:tyrosyl-tRNA synthetase
MMKYYELLTCLSVAELKSIRERIVQEPKATKMRLARQITAQYHGEEAAVAAEAEFEKMFGKTGDGLPDEIEELELAAPAEGLPLMRLLTLGGLAESGGEARRLLQQGGVKVDQQKVNDGQKMFLPGSSFIVQAGKRKFKKLTLRPE